jgi:hypothetical protein
MTETSKPEVVKSNRGGRRPGAGRPRKQLEPAIGQPRELRAVELVGESDQRGAIAVTTPHGVRIEGLTFEQMLRLLGGIA